MTVDNTLTIVFFHLFIYSFNYFEFWTILRMKGDFQCKIVGVGSSLVGMSQW